MHIVKRQKVNSDNVLTNHLKSKLTKTSPYNLAPIQIP